MNEFFPGIGKRLEETLGKIEKVKGYIVVRESASLVSLNFFKNLKEIQPGKKFDLRTLKYVPDLYNDRYGTYFINQNITVQTLFCSLYLLHSFEQEK